MKIGIQGVEASYHEIAAHLLYPGVKLYYYDTFGKLFAALRSNDVDIIVVAIANNRLGFIPEPHEELLKAKDKISIVGEKYLRIEHALLGIKGSKIKNLKEVHSQTPALDQCRYFLSSTLPYARIVEQRDTAISAKMVSEWNDPTKAAIASLEAAKKYGLSVIQPTVQDDAANITRFLEVKLKADHKVSNANKTTMILKTPQVPGALYYALKPFQQASINLSSLQSLLIPNTAFNMDFFIEYEAGIQESKSNQVLDKLKADGYDYQIIGSYKRANIPLNKV